MSRRWAVALLLVGALGCASTPPPDTPAAVAEEDAATGVSPAADVTADVVAKDDRIAPGLRVRVVCSETESRTAIAIIEWRQPPAAFAAEERLDFTVYKDGFQKGWFATLSMTPGGEVRMTERLRTMEGARKSAAFNVTAVRAVDRAGFERDKDTVAIEVRNVEPGILYRWRLAARTERGWFASEEVQVEIPVCVDDREGRN